MSAPACRIDIVSLFPALFDSYLGQSILRRALRRGWWR